METLVQIIKNKMTDHIREVEATKTQLEVLNNTKKDKKDIDLARRIMVLKDKLMFHKACSMVLQDVLDERDSK